MTRNCMNPSLTDGGLVRMRRMEVRMKMSRSVSSVRRRRREREDTDEEPHQTNKQEHP